MDTATLDNAEVELLWAMTKAVELLKNILRKGVRIYARFKYAIMGTIPYDNRRSV